MTNEHPVIWLQPWCEHCEWCDQGESNGRMWCQDGVFEKCDECGRMPVKYVIASDQPAQTEA